MIGTRFGVDVGIAVTAGGVTAVTRRAGGEATAVLVDGWPTQSLDTHDEEALSAVIQHLHANVWLDVDQVVVTYPADFGPARANRLREAVTMTGWRDVRLVAAPAAIALVDAEISHPENTVVADVTGARCQAAVLTPQPETGVGCVSSRVTEREEQGLVATINAATSAAEVDTSDIARVVIVGTPPAEQAAVEILTEAGVAGATAVSPVQLAEDGLRADDLIAPNRPRYRAAPHRGWWPRPLSSLACAVASLVLLVTVSSTAGSSGAQPDASAFGLGCLGMVTAIQGAATYLAARSTATDTGPAAWVRAGRCMLIGAATGAVLVVAAVVTLAAVFGVSPWPLFLAGGMAVVVTLASTGHIGIGIAWHPDQPPRRNIWPPVGAMTAVCAVAVLVHSSTPVLETVSDLEALPMRLGVGVWMFAITGLVIEAPWPRVLAGLAVGVAASFAVTAATVPVFAVIVIAVVSGWWLVTATLISFDRHGLPAPQRPRHTATIRTVH